MADDKAKTTAKSRKAPRPSTLLNHVEAYCRENDLGQENTIDDLVKSIERDIIDEAKRRG